MYKCIDYTRIATTDPNKRKDSQSSEFNIFSNLFLKEKLI